MLIKNQQGVGLLEVLVALLLLAVAVLGFSAMQFRAIQATDETLTRSDAMVIIRNVSEDLRLLPTTDQKNAYKTALSTPSSVECTKGKTGAVVCTPVQRAQYNAAQVVALAKSSNILINAVDCPVVRARSVNQGNINKLCIIASWNETTADMLGNDKSCANGNGTYKSNASCIIMETY